MKGFTWSRAVGALAICLASLGSPGALAQDFQTRLENCLTNAACADRVGTQLVSLIEGQGDGFYSPTAEELSPIEAAAIEKVFTLSMGVVSPVERTSQEMSASMQAAALSMKEGDFNYEVIQFTRELVQNELTRECSARQTGKTHHCQVYDELNKCASFATDKGRRIWTAAHCIGRWLEKARSVQGTPVVFVHDYRGARVAGPLKLEQLGTDRSFRFDEGFATLNRDSFSFTLEQPVKAFFEIEKSKTSFLKITALGYPAATGQFAGSQDPNYPPAASRPRRDGLNAVGGKLMLSRGETLEPIGVFAALRSTSYGPELPSILAPESIFSSADVVAGMSGGPSIDATSGRVIGVTTGGLWEVIYEHARTISVIARPSDWR